jgi:hypothetical protein
MHAVVLTPTFLADAAGLTEDTLMDIVGEVSNHPAAGVLMPGTGGARKRRIAGHGKGKRGGYRVITHYAGDDVPVFLLAFLSKGERADISQKEKNALRIELSALANDYRSGVRMNIISIGKRS